jgi:hypothetical protein
MQALQNQKSQDTQTLQQREKLMLKGMENNSKLQKDRDGFQAATFI